MIQGHPAITLDDYAVSMFRYDMLNWRWINLCARYLESVFGDRIRGAAVVDYACGRGNFAVAFRVAGADQVVAVDAAEANVRRLSEWCRREKVEGVKAIQGNLLEGEIEAPVADILWVHGLLPCVAVNDVHRLLGSLVSVLRPGSGILHAYSYDRTSLRQLVVELARLFARYGSEREFRADAALFSPPARLRARDDLTAPVVVWYSAAELVALLESVGLSVRRRDPDFAAWRRGGTSEEEFQPHLYYCERHPGGSEPGVAAEPRRPHAADRAMLARLAEPLFDLRTVDPTIGRKRAIGLFNCHFSALRDGGTVAALIDDFLYLFYLFLESGTAWEELAEPAASMVDLAAQAMVDGPRPSLGDSELAEGAIARHLTLNTIRL